jgi:hypothetical protein
MSALLTACPQKPSASRLHDLASHRTVVLLVDALNEVPADVARRIQLALDQYVRIHDRVRVLVTDRRVEQFYRESGWTALELRGVDADEAQRVVDEEFGEGTYGQLPEPPAATPGLVLPGPGAAGETDAASRSSDSSPR